MSDKGIELGSEIQASMEGNASREVSQATAKKIKEANPRAVDIKHMLTSSIIDGTLSLRDSFTTAKDLGLIKFEDPAKDRIGDSAMTDNLRMFLFNEGNALKQPSTKTNESFYICNALLMGTRLPVVMEGVKQVMSQIKSKDYGRIENGGDIKRRKMERLNECLYSLEDFQVELVTDSIAEKTGEAKEQVRPKVESWSQINNQVEEFAKEDVQLRSILERPVTLTEVDPKVEFTPV